MIGWWAAAVAVGIGLVVLGPLVIALARRADTFRQLLDRSRAELAVKSSVLRRDAAPIRARRTGRLSVERR